MDEAKRKSTHFVAFWPQHTFPGEYAKRRLTVFEVRRFCGNEGDGFWSLVRGCHETLVAIEALKTTVQNQEIAASDTKNPGASGVLVGDEILVVIPPDDFVALDEKAIDDIDYASIEDEAASVPIPACELEVWIRTS